MDITLKIILVSDQMASLLKKVSGKFVSHSETVIFHVIENVEYFHFFLRRKP